MYSIMSFFYNTHDAINNCKNYINDSLPDLGIQRTISKIASYAKSCYNNSYNLGIERGLSCLLGGASYVLRAVYNSGPDIGWDKTLEMFKKHRATKNGGNTEGSENTSDPIQDKAGLKRESTNSRESLSSTAVEETIENLEESQKTSDPKEPDLNSQSTTPRQCFSKEVKETIQNQRESENTSDLIEEKEISSSVVEDQKKVNPQNENRKEGDIIIRNPLMRNFSMKAFYSSPFMPHINGLLKQKSAPPLGSLEFENPSNLGSDQNV